MGPKGDVVLCYHLLSLKTGIAVYIVPNAVG